MVAGTRSFTLEDTFLEPQVLDPPPTRHALFLFLLALAAVLHLATAGWGDLHNGLEGQFAGGAREMLATQQWLVPTNNAVPRLETPPLVYWLIILSYKIFGVTATASRLPIAFAMIVSIALTFLIGERLAGYWRGFTAGLVHLCSGGAFLLGRMVTHDSIFAVFLAGAIYCAICGYQHRKFRWTWFAGFWLCASLACLAKGPGALLYLAGICGLLAIFFREARMRFLLLPLVLFAPVRPNNRPLVYLDATAFPRIPFQLPEWGCRLAALAISAPSFRVVVPRHLSHSSRIIFRAGKDFPAAGDDVRGCAPTLLAGNRISPSLDRRSPSSFCSRRYSAPGSLRGLRLGANRAAISHRRYRPRAPGWWRRRRDGLFYSTPFLFDHHRDHTWRRITLLQPHHADRLDCLGRLLAAGAYFCH
jgi:hypothetical protein